jgi:hypothetical protein
VHRLAGRKPVPIDQTSFRTKVNDVDFGLTKFETKDCTYTYNFSYSHWLVRGGDDQESRKSVYKKDTVKESVQTL